MLLLLQTPPPTSIDLTPWMQGAMTTIITMMNQAGGFVFSILAMMVGVKAVLWLLHAVFSK